MGKDVINFFKPISLGQFSMRDSVKAIGSMLSIYKMPACVNLIGCHT